MLTKRASALTGLGLGACTMYFLDPERGGRRRALVRDRLVHSARLTRDAAGATGRDVAHRSHGLGAWLGGNVWRRPVGDDVLVQRVRSRLGRLLSHPHAIDVSARDGVVTLRGPVLQHEVVRLLESIAAARGVREVVNELDAHKEPGNIPSLQGGATPPGLQPDILQREWAPATRVAVGGAGAALASYGLARRDVPGALLAMAGAGFLARAGTNLETRRLTGIGAGRRAVDVHKTITINAPLDQVFEFWSNYENFPHFMSRVLEVHPTSVERRSHWKVAGPAGVPIEFDADVSAFVPNEVFAWRTVDGAPVGHAGIVRFEPAANGGTRVDIRMSYNPPGGWVGHGIASAFGVDPKHSLDADLARLKTLLETGRPAHDAAQPVR